MCNFSFIFRTTIFASILLCGSISDTFSQLNPGNDFLTLTNRRMGYLGDASAVVWNPSLLGATKSTMEIMLAGNIDVAYPVNAGTSPFMAFVRSGPIGLGYVSRANIGSDTLSAQYILGGGWALTNKLRMGLSVGYKSTSNGSFLDRLRGNLSFMYAPYDRVAVSAGMSNNNFGSQSAIVYSLAGIYSPLDWLSAHATIDYYAINDIAAGTSGTTPQFGLSIAPVNGISISGMYNPRVESFRIGLEFLSGGISAGLIPSLQKPRPNSESHYYYTGLLRWTDEIYFDAGTVIAEGGSSSGASSHTDYTCRNEAYKWIHSIAPTSEIDLMGYMQFAGSEYKDLYQELLTLSPDLRKLYSQIANKYYSSTPNTSAPPSSVSYTTPPITSLNGYTILIDSLVTNQLSNETLMLFRVVDASGRMVTNLKPENFALTDTTRSIKQFGQTASQNKTTADFVILMDCSGSMSDEIASVRNNVAEFSRTLTIRNIDYRIGSILFKEDVFAKLDPTSNLNEFTTFFSQATAKGYDEINSQAIADLDGISFRPNAKKIAILITDDCSMQGNTSLTESDLVHTLWKKGINLYGVVNPAKHNAGFVTRLSLGKEYDVTKPFNTILDDISGAITTTYQLTAAPKPKVEIPTTYIRGIVKSESGWNLDADVAITTTTAKGVPASRQVIKTNPLSGEYFVEVPKGASISLNASAPDHLPAVVTVAVANTNRNDTIVQNILLKQPKTILKGVVYDEAKRPLAASIKIEDATTLALVNDIQTNSSGAYSIEIPEGNIYRLTPTVKNYIANPADVDMRTTKRGTVVTQDLLMTSINTAIDKGLTFKLKNIFFDSGKWDLRSESFEEINKLLAFLGEYQVVRIEIGAHTDNLGSDETNNSLSQKRAQSVVDYLKSKGIQENRMVAKGYGETVAVATNDTPEGRQLNRRVEFKLVR